MHDIEHPSHELPKADDMAPSREVPLWMPDLFGWLCEQLEPDVDLIEARRLADWVEKDGCDHLNDLLGAIQETTDGNAPQRLLDYASGYGLGVTPDFVLKAQLLAAMAIDHALLNLARRTLGETVEGSHVQDPIRLEYLATGNCARCPEYVVVPAEPRKEEGPRSGTSLDRHFNNVRFMTRRSLGSRWTVKTVMVGDKPGRFNGLEFRPKALEERDLQVSVVPLAQALSDVTVEAFPHGGVMISPSKSQEARLATRASQAIRRAVSEGAHIIVFPEWVVSPAVAIAIRNTLRSLTVDERDHLQLVIAGTGLTTPAAASGLFHAECLVFDSWGVELWRQGKMHQWSMNHEAQQAAGLEVKDDGRREHFHPSNVVCLAETPVGRCLILICEDLQQDRPSRDLISYLLPRWVFSPVFDLPVHVYTWAARKAHDLAKTFRATVVVSNSLALALPSCAGAGKNEVPATAPYGVLFSSRNSRQVMIGSIPTAALPPQEDPLIANIGWDPERASTLDISAD